MIKPNPAAVFSPLVFPSAAQASSRFYRYLCDLIVEISKGHGLKAGAYVRYVRFRNPELVARLIEKNKPVFLLAGHYGNWEFMNIFAAMTTAPTLAVYQPPKDGYFDGYLSRGRARFGAEQVQMDRWIITWMASSKLPAPRRTARSWRIRTGSSWDRSAASSSSTKTARGTASHISTTSRPSTSTEPAEPGQSPVDFS